MHKQWQQVWVFIMQARWYPLRLLLLGMGVILLILPSLHLMGVPV